MWPHLLRACALAEFRVNSDCTVLGSACVQRSCEAPAKQKKKKKETHTVTQLAHDYFWTGSGPALRRFTSHNTTFTQPKSFCGFCSSQNTLVQSPNVFLARPDSDRLCIMTFSEIGPGSLKCNAFDRCLSLQLHKSRWVRGRSSAEKAGCCGLLRAKLWGISDSYRLSPSHLRTRIRTRSGEGVCGAYAVTRLIMGKWIHKLPVQRCDRLQARGVGQEAKTEQILSFFFNNFNRKAFNPNSNKNYNTTSKEKVNKLSSARSDSTPDCALLSRLLRFWSWTC